MAGIDRYQHKGLKYKFVDNPLADIKFHVYWLLSYTSLTHVYVALGYVMAGTKGGWVNMTQIINEKRKQ